VPEYIKYVEGTYFHIFEPQMFPYIETNSIFAVEEIRKLFNVILSDQAIDFLNDIDTKARKKILYNIDRSCYVQDPRRFKKISTEFWEFRILFKSLQYRLLAFWDKESKENTIVIVSHGFVKKTSKIPKDELLRARGIRTDYYNKKKRQ
jgi:phage-related protein